MKPVIINVDLYPEHLQHLGTITMRRGGESPVVFMCQHELENQDRGPINLATSVEGEWLTIRFVDLFAPKPQIEDGSLITRPATMEEIVGRLLEDPQVKLLGGGLVYITFFQVAEFPLQRAVVIGTEPVGRLVPHAKSMKPITVKE